MTDLARFMLRTNRIELMDSPSPKSGTKMHTVLTGTKFPERVFSTKDMIGVFSAEPQLPIYVSKCKVMMCSHWQRGV